MSSYGQGGPDLGLASEGSDRIGRKNVRSRYRHDDVEMKSSGSSETESHGNESHGSHGNESHGNESHGNESTGSSNGNSKDSALLESSGSNKRSVGGVKWFVGGVRVDHVSLWVPFYHSYVLPVQS